MPHLYGLVSRPVDGGCHHLKISGFVGVTSGTTCICPRRARREPNIHQISGRGRGCGRVGLLLSLEIVFDYLDYLRE